MAYPRITGILGAFMLSVGCSSAPVPTVVPAPVAPAEPADASPPGEAEPTVAAMEAQPTAPAVGATNGPSPPEPQDPVTRTPLPPPEPVPPPSARIEAQARRLLARGNRLYARGEYGKAEEVLKEALLLYPFMAEANLALGKVFLIKGSATRDMALVNSARLMFEMARAMNPDLREAALLLELFHSKQAEPQ